ncbi:hypothetical protein U9M48_017788 [Paspalum notatum var. saurae]|uniref:Uncharacterized protein n=1 Tax=Paspalum notatum var. saurae TaxID=547442 RepID=A0AAQ3T8P9_PASNO
MLGGISAPALQRDRHSCSFPPLSYKQQIGRWGLTPIETIPWAPPVLPNPETIAQIDVDKALRLMQMSKYSLYSDDRQQSGLDAIEASRRGSVNCLGEGSRLIPEVDVVFALP